jgi:calcineurin-like phosphoesterase family protein
MSNVKFIGCLHLGHANLVRDVRGFDDINKYHDYLIKQWNSVVHKKDLVYILGDITMETPEHYYLLDQLQGRKKVILGNHDMGKDIPELLKHVETVAGMLHYKGYWITHAPVHPQELTFTRGNIHAHVHTQPVKYSEVYVDYWDCKKTIKSREGLLYHNVDAQVLDYKPLTINEITNAKK